MASAAPNKFVSECNAFKSYAKECDKNTYSLIKDIVGYIPGASLIITIGEMIYDGAIRGDSSKALGDALYSYVLAVAGTICQPAKVIASAIDGISLLYNLRQVRNNWETMYNGQT